MGEVRYSAVRMGPGQSGPCYGIAFLALVVRPWGCILLLLTADSRERERQPSGAELILTSRSSSSCAPAALNMKLIIVHGKL